MATDESSMEFSDNNGHFSSKSKQLSPTEDTKSDHTGEIYEFNQDEETDLFHDANDQIIKTDLKTTSLSVSDNNFQIIDVYEERCNLPT